MEKSGVTKEMFTITPGVVEMMIHDYSRGEPGVRYLERSTTKLLEKIAYKKVN
jgi:ATP-dependent Lon protease